MSAATDSLRPAGSARAAAPTAAAGTPAADAPVSRMYAWTVFFLTYALFLHDYLSRQIISSILPVLKTSWTLLPMGIGLWLKARDGALAARLYTVAHRAWAILLVVVFAQLVYVYHGQVLEVDANALVAAVLLFAVALGVGYALGGPATADRRALAIMTFARNASIAMMIAGQVFTNVPGVLVMVTTLTIFSIVLTVVVASAFRRVPVRGAPSSSLPRSETPRPIR